MTDMDLVSTGRVAVGLKVLWLGGDEDGDVLNAARRGAGHILVHHHTGVVKDIWPLSHVLVAWSGLEDEPVSFAVGFSPNDQGQYVALGSPSEDTWWEMEREGWWASDADGPGGP